MLLHGLLHHLGTAGEHSGNLQLDDLGPGNLIGQQFHRLKRGVYGLSAKGIETSYQYFHLYSTPLLNR